MYAHLVIRCINMFYFLCTAVGIMWLQLSQTGVHGVCTDDPSYDCAHINTVFSICADVDHASKVCRNFCNLCNYNPAPVCADDPSFDCAHISQAFDICSDVSHASTVCKKFCNLCPGNTNPCAASPCKHGTCKASGHNYTCQCDTQYTGRNFDTHIDPCASSPCKHGGICQVSGHGYTCQCASRYTGMTCDTYINPCSSNPCLHGACQDNGHDYTCQCYPHYTGIICDTYNSPCTPNPCLNGQCLPHDTSYVCHCNVGYTGAKCNNKIRDCKDALDNHVRSLTNDVIYTVMIGNTMENVRCDMATDGGGWTVIMNRETASLNWTKDSTEYALGFGNARSDFWIGLENMHTLTADGRRYQLRVELTRGDGSKHYEVYDDFYVGPRCKFVLHVGTAHGDAGDSLLRHNGFGFSTFDHDQDPNNGYSCAKYMQGAWWFHNCYDSCLTCPYEKPGSIQCRSMSWNTLNYCEALKAARMLVRPM